VDQDGKLDICVGTQTGANIGNVQFWRGDGSGGFSLAATYVAPGLVQSLVTADYGGTGRKDLALGFRSDASSYAGGVRILFLDSGTLPLGGVDPAAGSQNWMAPAMVAGNFNFRKNPTTSGSPNQDLAVATKTGATTGELVVYVR